MKRSKRVAIDIETSGLHPYNGYIHCIAINDGKKTTIEIDPLKIKTLLEDETIEKVIHNAGFDATWLLLVKGINVRNIWDTRLCEQVILGETLSRSVKDEKMRLVLSSSLEYTLVRYGFPRLKKGMGAQFALRPWGAPLTKDEKDYVSGDVQYLIPLRDAQEALLTRDGLMEVALLENKTVEVVARMRARGIGFDKQAWLDIASENEEVYRELLKRMPSGINWNSPLQVTKFFQKRGVPLASLTDAEEMYETCGDEILGKFVLMRSLYKSVTTYGASWLTIKTPNGTRDTVDDDGRVRCDFTQILNTGRFSCDSPNLQQLPSKGKHRQAFVPKKGHVFVVGDFSGQELGIMAAASKETLWIDTLLRGDDLHSMTASMLYTTQWMDGRQKGCTFPQKCACPEHLSYREKAKALNFLLAYGGGAGKLALKTKVSKQEAQQVITKFKRITPHLNRWLTSNGEATNKSGESYSADRYKRRRFVQEPEEWRRVTVGKNNPVQSAGANMLKLSMISIPEQFPIVLVIHDEIILEVKKTEAAKAVLMLKKVMENAAAYCTKIDGIIKVTPKIKTNLLK